MRAVDADAARLLDFDDDAVTTVRRAALVHDFGTTGVPNSIWTSAARLRARSSIASNYTPC